MSRQNVCRTMGTGVTQIFDAVPAERGGPYVQIDHEVGALTVMLGRGERSVRTQQLDDSTLLDFDENGRLISVELLDWPPRVEP